MKDLDLDQLTMGLIRVSEDGQIRGANRAAHDLLGRGKGKLIDGSLGQVSPMLASVHERLGDMRGLLRVTECRAVPDGPVLDLVAQTIGADSLFEMQSVTERMRHRERAERADREQAITLLARSLAHELRNPLAGVRGAAQLIEHSSSASSATRHACMIQREVDRITALIDQVAEERPADLAIVNVHRPLEDALELVQAENAGRLVIDRRFDPSIPEQQLDEGKLHQLFLNLLRNSLQAGAHRLSLSSHIELDSPVVVPPCRHAIRIDIEDDGHGVPEAIRDRLFLPLVSGREGGSGFGLAVVQQIARTHGGLVDYHALSSGSRFTLRLPLRDSLRPDRPQA